MLGQQVVSLSEQRALRSASRQTPLIHDILLTSRLPRSGVLVRPKFQELAEVNAVARGQDAAIRPKGLVDGFVKTCQRWLLDSRSQAILLGYKDNETGALGILQGRVNIPSQDIHDRISYILLVSLTLGAIFNERTEAEIKWLSAKRDKFQGRSALDVLLEGRMTDLLAVTDFALAERGP